jgi:hypothetical protein
MLIVGTFVMLATYTLFYTVTTWALSYGTGKRPPGGSGLGSHTWTSFACS